MRIVNKPIQMIAWFKEDGTAQPLKFRYESTDNMWQSVKVDRILLQEKSRFVGIEALLFRCQSNTRGEERLYELRYEIDTQKWTLHKI